MKHVEQFPDKVNCVTLHLVGNILEDETCRRFFTCFYIILSDYNVFVGVCMYVRMYGCMYLTVRNMDNFKVVSQFVFT